MVQGSILLNSTWNNTWKGTGIRWNFSMLAIGHGGDALYPFPQKPIPCSSDTGLDWQQYTPLQTEHYRCALPSNPSPIVGPTIFWNSCISLKPRSHLAVLWSRPLPTCSFPTTADLTWIGRRRDHSRPPGDNYRLFNVLLPDTCRLANDLSRLHPIN